MTDHETPTRDDLMAALLRDAAATSFGPGFGDRVRARLDEERAQALPRALERQFIRIVPLAAAAALLLAAYNWWGARGMTSSALDAALNLPQATIASAYAESSLFDDSTITTGTP
ncbi:MAG: hypothetical protein ACREPM_23935 [Gemmatimonadaceae bacterium]